MPGKSRLNIRFFRRMVLMAAGAAIPALGADCTVQFGSLQQRMTGFGGSTAWKSGLADSLITRLFSPTEGCGLTLVRMRIGPDATTGSGEITIAKKAQALGASIWSAPWSPPANYKDNNNVNNGGSLTTSHYQDWADKLTTYAKNLGTQGINLKWISVQNEPNWTADYESCRYTPEQITSFAGGFLGPALEKAGLKTRIIAPEVINFGSLKPYADALLNDATAMKYVDVIATHQYGDNPKSPDFPYKLIADKGKELWETEHGMDNYAGDESMKGGIPLAKEMHTDIVKGPVSAYHVWWIIPGDGVNGNESNGLVLKGKVCQRGYVMGNYSRFVRPGSFRVATNDNPTSGIWVTAYRNDSLGRLTIVAINENTSATTQKFVLDGVTTATVTPWETSDAVKLTARDPVTAGASFSYSLPASSVISFVGTYTPTSSISTPKSAGKITKAEAPYANAALEHNAVTLMVRERGDYTVHVYGLEGALLATQAGKGQGLCRIFLGSHAHRTVILKFLTTGQGAFEERLNTGVVRGE